MDQIKIVERTDCFGGKYKAIPTTKRKAWNMLLKDNGIIQPNKGYILHNGLLWHNNSLLHELVSGL